ncbi:MAG: hypothetical protein IJV81_08180 [Paludibacteraceae bacterium]|nr:hypothetical protein [Paludibacteraceae bacterium]
MTKQECAIKYITENYLNFNRLRHDVIADKLQIRIADSLENASLQNAPMGLQFRGEDTWREMTKHDINSIVCHAAQEYDANITSREVITALQSDLIPDVHPLREYVRSCHTWTEDQPDWIDFVARQVHVVDASDIDRIRGTVDWAEPCRSASPEDRPTGCSVSRKSTASITSDLQCSASETNYSEPRERSKADALWRICFKKWFVAMVASWMNDEVVNHQVLVLIGRQGIFKTTWLEHLIPPHLRAYACKLANSNDLNKDERLRIAEFGLISLDEIDSMNNRELNQLKSVITATDVNERAAYAYTKERRVRLASFCASGNRRDFLTDITGNRRWLPFEVESIQNPFFTTLPYNRMYAQAWALAQDPLFSYWFDLDEIEVLEQHNQHFRDETNEEQLLPILFDVPAEGKGEFMTTAQISERLVTYGNIKKPMALSRLGMVLGAAGYQSTRPKIGGRLIRGWLVYQRDTDEIASLKRLLKE